MRITGAYRGDERFPHCRVHPHLCLIEQLVASRWIVRVLCRSQAIACNFVVSLRVRSPGHSLSSRSPDHTERCLNPIRLVRSRAEATRLASAVVSWAGRGLGGDLGRDPAVPERDGSANHDLRMHRTGSRFH
jgi:hypothetical protein